MPTERSNPNERARAADEPRESRVHSAVTLRPASPFAFSPSATPDPVVSRVDPAIVEANGYPPAGSRASDDPLEPPHSGTHPNAKVANLNLEALSPLPPFVLGYTARPLGGTLVMDGACNSRFDDRTAYFAHLAVLIGQEIGMNALRELHVVGKAFRIGHYVSRDATYFSILANVDCDVAEVARRVSRP